MKYQTAIDKLDGQSVGGQLIVNYNGVNTLVGRLVGDQLVPEETAEATAILAGVTDEEEAAPVLEHTPRTTRRRAAAPEPVVEPEPAVVEPDPVIEAQLSLELNDDAGAQESFGS